MRHLYPALVVLTLLFLVTPAHAQAPANIVGISFVDIASSRMALLQSTMDKVINAEAAVLHPVLRALFVLFVARQFLLVMWGHISINRLWDSFIRGGIIILLVTHSGEFANRVRDPMFNKIPQATAAMVGGEYANTTATQPLAAQFDSMAAKGDAITAEIDAVSTNILSPSDWINSLSGHAANGVFQATLAFIVGIWLLGQTLLAIILAMGMNLLCFELFDRTRGFVDQWIGKLVGSAAFGFSTSFVLAMQMNGMQRMFDAIKGQAANNATAAVGMFGHVISNALIDVLTMAVLPIAVGFGSGAVAALSAPSMMIAMRAITSSAGAAAGAASKASRVISRSANT